MSVELPFVTIAIPFFNAEKTLLDSIRSVFAQTHQKWELILLDDGSSDGSLKIAQSIKDPRVKVYSDGRNLRLCARLNQVTRLASYSYIARMDADDLMMPDRIEILLRILTLKNEYDLVSSGLYSIGSDGSLNGIRGKEESFYTFEGLLNKKQRFLHAGLVARKSWYERNKYDESVRIGEDTELWIRAAKNNDFKAMSIKTPLYMYREEGNVTKEKLLAAYKVGRKNIAPFIDSASERYKYILKSYLRSISVMLFLNYGFSGYLLGRRNSDFLSETEVSNYKKIYHDILLTKIPGIN